MPVERLATDHSHAHLKVANRVYRKNIYAYKLFKRDRKEISL